MELAEKNVPIEHRCCLLLLLDLAIKIRKELVLSWGKRQHKVRQGKVSFAYLKQRCVQ